VSAFTRALAVCGAVVIADQVTKAIAVASIQPTEQVHLALGFVLARVENKGFAFGALGDGGTLVLVVAAAALVAVLVWFALDPTRPGLWLGVGLLAGGALGNLADRARVGAVTDFVDPPLWPAFNLGDLAITVGAVVLVLVSIGASGGAGTSGAPSRP